MKLIYPDEFKLKCYALETSCIEFILKQNHVVHMSDVGSKKATHHYSCIACYKTNEGIKKEVFHGHFHYKRDTIKEHRPTTQGKKKTTN